jgi:hypothetical protein
MKVVESIRSLAGKVRSGFDVRDSIVLCGLAMTGYGLYLFRPWVSFTVCGVLLMAGGILMERKNGNS